LRAERIRKLENLQALGVDCFPAKISLTGTRVKTTVARQMLDEGNIGTVLLAGRVMTIRGQGKILFVDLQDEAGKFQIVLKKDVLGEEKINLFFDSIDAGDFAAFTGNLFVTQRGEKSLEATDWQILTKTILPIPSSFYGLENEEERMRKRYLDILLNPELKERFYRKAKFWKTVRNFLEERGFVEVETPTIETTTGGAEARPFKTYHNDYDLDVFMRIDIGELWQKRLLAAGFEKTYQIGKAYRNEGSSPTHLQEFTNCEFYWAYSEYKEGMQMIKDLYRKIAREVYGKTDFEITTNNVTHKFDLNDEWEEIDYRGEILKRTRVDIFVANEDEIKSKLQSLGVVWDGDGKERLTDTLWKYCRKQISGPAFLVNHPAFISQLSKHNLDGLTSQVFQPIIAGAEAGKGFSELNNYQVQRANFERQKQLLEAGDEEAMMPDFSFVEMLEHGMPPAFGYGFGERLFAFFEGVPIREIQMFPLIKPKEELKVGKKETKVAHIVLNREYGLEKWQELNAVAHLGAEFAGNIGKELFYKKEIKTKDEKSILLNIQHAIVVKQAENKSQIFNLIDNAQKEGIKVYSFTQEMLQTTNDKKVEEITKTKNFKDIDFLGVLVFGEKKEIDLLTNNFELYK
jgi:lysyl-tRNA synthetase class 2